MAIVPVITSPCPLRLTSLPQPGADFCGRCQRKVHSLDGMSDAARKHFFATCSGEVCVSYTVAPVAAMAGLVALGVAAALVPLTADAQGQAQAPTPVVTGQTCPVDSIIVTGGGVKTDAVQWVDEREAARPRPPRIGEIEAVDWLPDPAASAPAGKDAPPKKAR